MIYYTTRIYKEDNGAERGDTNFRKEVDMPEFVVPCRILLSDVRGWEYYMTEDENYWKNKDNKVRVMFRDLQTSILIVDLKEFDIVMENFIRNQIIYKQN